MRSSNKVLTIAVVLLLLVNITLVIFLVTGKSRPEPSRRASPFESMMKDLGMNDDQKKSFDQYREDHLNRIRPLMDSVRVAKAIYFGNIKDSAVSDSALMVYGKKITDLQESIYKLTYSHFQRVRTLFEGQQQKKYDDFLQKMLLRRDSSGKKKDTTARSSQ